jgi:uncharacterized protein YjiS (DUF1127 family)
METEMALVLDRGRPGVRSTHLAELVTAWFAKMRAARAQRQALAHLLELDAYRLDDLGINRADLFAAIDARAEPSRVLAERRRQGGLHS